MPQWGIEGWVTVLFLLVGVGYLIYTSVQGRRNRRK
jgi:hypothetical protein